MPSSPQPLETVPWPVVLLCASWLLTVVIVAVLVHAIAKAAINKTDARDLPTVLTTIVQLVSGVTRSIGPLPPPGIATTSSVPRRNRRGGKASAKRRRLHDQAEHKG